MSKKDSVAPELKVLVVKDLEHESSSWRGLFLCSAFVIEASNPSEYVHG